MSAVQQVLLSTKNLFIRFGNLDGNIFKIFNLNGNTFFNNNTHIGNEVVSSGIAGSTTPTNNIFITKRNISDFSQIWGKLIDITPFQYGAGTSHMTQTTDGDFVVFTSRTESNGPDVTRFFLVKVNSTGNIVYSKFVDVSDRTSTKCINVLAVLSGHYYISWFNYNTLTIHIKKFTNNGVSVWERSVTLTAQNESAINFVNGMSISPFNGDIAICIDSARIYVFDLNGNLKFSKQISGSGSISMGSIAFDELSNLYCSFRTQVNTGVTVYNNVLIKISPAGDLIFSKRSSNNTVSNTPQVPIHSVDFSRIYLVGMSSVTGKISIRILDLDGNEITSKIVSGPSNLAVSENSPLITESGLIVKINNIAAVFPKNLPSNGAYNGYTISDIDFNMTNSIDISLVNISPSVSSPSTSYNSVTLVANDTNVTFATLV